MTRFRQVRRRKPLDMIACRLFCPKCGRRECDLRSEDPEIAQEQWECAYCLSNFIVPAGMVPLLPTHASESLMTVSAFYPL